MILDKQVMDMGLPDNVAARSCYWLNVQTLGEPIAKALREGSVVLQLERKPGTGDVRVIATAYRDQP